MPIWADAVFVWNPGDAVIRPFDEVTSTSSDVAVTEGTFVSTPRDGRTYTGNQGSRFALASIPNDSDFTLMCAVRSPTGSEAVYGLWTGDKDSDRKWARIAQNNTLNATATLFSDYRGSSTTIRANGWPVGEWDDNTSSTAIRVLVARYNYDAGLDMYSVELFADGAYLASGFETKGAVIDIDRISVGWVDDFNQQADSNGGQVFAAAAWARALTDAEMRAISSDPYSYPTDPSDPGWETGVDEWSGCRFYYDPNHGSRSADRASGSGLCTTALTDGTEVTVLTIDGREYNGAVGARWEKAIIDQFDLDSPSTQMAVVRMTAGTSKGSAVWHGARDSDRRWYTSGRHTDGGADATWEAAARRSSTTPGGANWPIAQVADADDTDIHVIVARIDGAGSAEIFVDNFATTGTDGPETWNGVNGFFDRITVGRNDDSAPTSNVTFQVFRAAVWDRELSDAEVQAVLADPYGFPGATVPVAPSNPAAVAVSASQIDVTWDDVADETGYRVERSPNGSSGWADVSGNLAAGTTSYSDTGLTASTQYFYRVIAFNGVGDSTPSTVVNATTQAGPATGTAVLPSSLTRRLIRRRTGNSR
jgi:hypothetical protein